MWRNNGKAAAAYEMLQWKAAAVTSNVLVRDSASDIVCDIPKCAEGTAANFGKANQGHRPINGLRALLQMTFLLALSNKACHRRKHHQHQPTTA